MNGYVISTHEPDDNRDSIIMQMFARPIAYHRIFVTLTGSVTAAVMLSQAFYWSKVTKNPAGWFYKTAEEWEEETGLSRKEQATARKKLKEHKWWQEELRKANGAPTLHYRINQDGFINELLSTSGNSNLPNGENPWNLPDGEKPINIDYTESTDVSAPPKRKRHTTPEHIVVANSAGLDAKQMRELVDAVLDVTGKRVVADGDDLFADRALAGAQECAAGLVSRGVTTPAAVVKLAEAFQQVYGFKNPPAYSQLVGAVSLVPQTNSAAPAEYQFEEWGDD